MAAGVEFTEAGGAMICIPTGGMNRKMTSIGTFDRVRFSSLAESLGGLARRSSAGVLAREFIGDWGSGRKFRSASGFGSVFRGLRRTATRAPWASERQSKSHYQLG